MYSFVWKATTEVTRKFCIKNFTLKILRLFLIVQKSSKKNYAGFLVFCKNPEIHVKNVVKFTWISEKLQKKKKNTQKARANSLI